MSRFFIFYSWQSDLPNSTNRGFIERALSDSIAAIRQDNQIQVEPAIDRDTLGIPGAPNIAEAILRKIDQAQAFVCDVSIINSRSKFRSTPNPNVLFELGYAYSKLGSGRIVLVFNTAYGRIEDAPFDLKQIRTITYSAHESSENKAFERRNLQKKLETAISAVILGKDEQKYRALDFFITDEEVLFDIIQVLCAIHHFRKSQVEQVIKSKTSLYKEQSKLLIEYLIDFDYIKPVSQGHSFFTLGTKGRGLYNKHTRIQEEERKRLEELSKLYNQQQ